MSGMKLLKEIDLETLRKANLEQSYIDAFLLQETESDDRFFYNFTNSIDALYAVKDITGGDVLAAFLGSGFIDFLVIAKSHRKTYVEVWRANVI